jgi:hypothetical protein
VPTLTQVLADGRRKLSADFAEGRKGEKGRGMFVRGMGSQDSGEANGDLFGSLSFDKILV